MKADQFYLRILHKKVITFLMKTEQFCLRILQQKVIICFVEIHQKVIIFPGIRILGWVLRKWHVITCSFGGVLYRTKPCFLHIFLPKGFLQVQSTISSSHYSILLYIPLQKKWWVFLLKMDKKVMSFFVKNGQKSDEFPGNKEVGWDFEKMACDVLFLGGWYCSCWI